MHAGAGGADGGGGEGIAGRELWSAVHAAGVGEMALLASASSIGVKAPLALGSWCRQWRQRRLAASAWLEARDEEREQVSEISCCPAAWHIATQASSLVLIQGEEVVLGDGGDWSCRLLLRLCWVRPISNYTGPRWCSTGDLGLGVA